MRPAEVEYKRAEGVISIEKSYVDRINEFYSCVDYLALRADEISLYLALLHVCNRNYWREEFSAPNRVLCIKAGLERDKLLRARNGLKTKGLIDFKKGRNQYDDAVYRLLDFAPEGSYGNLQSHIATANATASATPNDTASATASAQQPRQRLIGAREEGERDRESSPLPPEGEAPPAQGAEKAPDYARVLELFKQLCPSLPEPKGVTKPRQGAINSAGKILKKNGLRFSQLFERVEASDFLTGRDDRWDKCGFDWILKPANLQKILEGNYDNKQQQGGANRWDWD